MLQHKSNIQSSVIKSIYILQRESTKHHADWPDQHQLPKFAQTSTSLEISANLSWFSGMAFRQQTTNEYREENMCAPNGKSSVSMKLRYSKKVKRRRLGKRKTFKAQLAFHPSQRQTPRLPLPSSTLTDDLGADRIAARIWQRWAVGVFYAMLWDFDGFCVTDGSAWTLIEVDTDCITQTQDAKG